MHGTMKRRLLEEAPEESSAPLFGVGRVVVVADEHYSKSHAVIHSYIQELLNQIPAPARLDIVFRGDYRGPRIKSYDVPTKVYRLRGLLHAWDVKHGPAEPLMPRRVRSIYHRLVERRRWLANFAPADTRLLRLLFRAEEMSAVICFTHSLHFARQIARWLHIFCQASIPRLVVITPQLHADRRIVGDLKWLRATLLHDAEVRALTTSELGGQSGLAPIPFAEAQHLSFFDPGSYPYRHEFSRDRIDWPSWIGPACPRPARVRDVVLFIRPDWMSCGSGTYFESLATYFQSRDTLLIDLAIWPFGEPYSRDVRCSKLREQEQSIRAALYFGLRRTVSPLRLLRQIPKLLTIPPTTTTTQNLFAYNLVTCPRILTDCIRNARINAVYLNHYFTYSFARDLIGDREFHLDTHDLQSVNYLQEGYRNALTGRMDSFAAMFRAEMKILQRAHRLSFVSLSEIEMVKGYIDRAKVFDFIAMPHVDPLPPRPAARRPRLLIVASNNRANGRNLEWFLGQVWPAVTASWKARTLLRDLRLDVVGGVKAHFAGREYEGVTFHGVVDNLDDYYRVCDAVILPVITGSGAAMKTIEALLYGRPVIGTHHAFRGLPAKVGELVGHAATAEDLAREIVAILSCEQKLVETAEAARIAGDVLRNRRYFESLTVALDAIRTPRPACP